MPWHSVHGLRKAYHQRRIVPDICNLNRNVTNQKQMSLKILCYCCLPTKQCIAGYRRNGECGRTWRQDAQVRIYQYFRRRRRKHFSNRKTSSDASHDGQVFAKVGKGTIITIYLPSTGEKYQEHSSEDTKDTGFTRVITFWRLPRRLQESSPVVTVTTRFLQITGIMGLGV